MKKTNIIYMTLAWFGAYSIIGMLIGSLINGFTFNIAYQLLLVCIVSALLRYFIYSPDTLEGKSYLFRNVCFFSLFLPFLFTVAYFGQWFPIEPEPVIMFVIIFIIIGTIIGLYYNSKMKREGFSYSEKLKEYKENHKA